MHTCPDCHMSFSRIDNMRRHQSNKHGGSDEAQVLPHTSEKMTFQHPFTMVVSGPSGSGKTEWTRKTLLSNMIKEPVERIIWCFGQWQHLYDEIQRTIPWIEFSPGIPDFLSSRDYFDARKKNLIIFDDLMTEAKCDQRVADLFTKGSHHRNLSVIYLTQNLFPQGKACRDIALDTQYLVLFNNPIDRQQVATLAKRIYPSNSGIFMKIFEQATTKPYGYLVVDLKSSTPEKDRFRTDIFEQNKMPWSEGSRGSDSDNDMEYFGEEMKERQPFLRHPLKRTKEADSDNESIDGDEVNKKRRISMGPPGKRYNIHVDLRERGMRKEIWNKRFQEPLRESNREQFNAQVNDYLDEGHTREGSIARSANDILPSLRKQLRLEYADFLIDYHRLEEGSIQPQILQSAETLRKEHGMDIAESIRQAIKLRKDLFYDLWPNHSVSDADNSNKGNDESDYNTDDNADENDDSRDDEEDE